MTAIGEVGLRLADMREKAAGDKAYQLVEARLDLRLSLKDAFWIVTTVALLAAGAKAVGLSGLALLVLAVLAIIVALSRPFLPRTVLYLTVPALVLVVIWWLLPDVQ